MYHFCTNTQIVIFKYKWCFDYVQNVHEATWPYWRKANMSTEEIRKHFKRPTTTHTLTSKHWCTQNDTHTHILARTHAQTHAHVNNTHTQRPPALGDPDLTDWISISSWEITELSLFNHSHMAFQESIWDWTNIPRNSLLIQLSHWTCYWKDIVKKLNNLHSRDVFYCPSLCF